MASKDRILAIRAAILDRGQSFAEVHDAGGYSIEEIRAAFAGDATAGVDPLPLSSLTRLYYLGDRKAFFSGSGAEKDSPRDQLSYAVSGQIRVEVKKAVEQWTPADLQKSVQEGGVLYSFASLPNGREFLIKQMSLDVQLKFRNALRDESRTMFYTGTAATRMRDGLDATLVDVIKPKMMDGSIDREAMLKAGFTEADFERARQGLIEEYLKPAIASGELDAAVIEKAGFTADHMAAAREKYLEEAKAEALRLDASTEQADRIRRIPQLLETVKRAAYAGADVPELQRWVDRFSSDVVSSSRRREMMDEARRGVVSTLLAQPSTTKDNLRAGLEASGFDMNLTALDPPEILRTIDTLSPADAIRLRALAENEPKLQSAAQLSIDKHLHQAAFAHGVAPDPTWAEFPGATDADKATARQAYLNGSAREIYPSVASPELKLRSAMYHAQRAMAMGATPDEIKKFAAELPEALQAPLVASVAQWPQTQALWQELTKEGATPESLQAVLASGVFKGMTADQLAALPATLLDRGALTSLLDMTQNATSDEARALFRGAEAALATEIKRDLINADKAQTAALLDSQPPVYIESVIQDANLLEARAIRDGLPDKPAQGDDPYAMWREMATDRVHERVAQHLVTASNALPDKPMVALNAASPLQYISPEDMQGGIKKLNLAQAQRIATQIKDPKIQAMLAKEPELAVQYGAALDSRIAWLGAHEKAVTEQLARYQKDEANPDIALEQRDRLLATIAKAQTDGLGDDRLKEMIAALPADKAAGLVGGMTPDNQYIAGLIPPAAYAAALDKSVAEYAAEQPDSAALIHRVTLAEKAGVPKEKITASLEKLTQQHQQAFIRDAAKLQSEVLEYFPPQTQLAAHIEAFAKAKQGDEITARAALIGAIERAMKTDLEPSAITAALAELSPQQINDIAAQTKTQNPDVAGILPTDSMMAMKTFEKAVAAFSGAPEAELGASAVALRDQLNQAFIDGNTREDLSSVLATLPPEKAQQLGAYLRDNRNEVNLHRTQDLNTDVMALLPKPALQALLVDSVAAYRAATPKTTDEQLAATTPLLRTMRAAKEAGIDLGEMKTALAEVPLDKMKVVAINSVIKQPGLLAAFSPQSQLYAHAAHYSAAKGDEVTPKGETLLAAITQAKTAGVPDAEITSILGGELTPEHTTALAALAGDERKEIAALLPPAKGTAVAGFVGRPVKAPVKAAVEPEAVPVLPLTMPAVKKVVAELTHQRLADVVKDAMQLKGAGFKPYEPITDAEAALASQIFGVKVRDEKGQYTPEFQTRVALIADRTKAFQEGHTDIHGNQLVADGVIGIKTGPAMEKHSALASVLGIQGNPVAEIAPEVGGVKHAAMVVQEPKSLVVGATLAGVVSHEPPLTGDKLAVLKAGLAQVALDTMARPVQAKARSVTEVDVHPVHVAEKVEKFLVETGAKPEHAAIVSAQLQDPPSDDEQTRRVVDGTQPKDKVDKTKEQGGRAVA